MTAGELLISLSGLSGVTALAHLMAISASGAPGAASTAFAFVTLSENTRVVVSDSERTPKTARISEEIRGAQHFCIPAESLQNDKNRNNGFIARERAQGETVIVRTYNICARIQEVSVVVQLVDRPSAHTSRI